MQLVQHLGLKRAGHAKAVAARAEAVEEPVPPGEDAPRGTRRRGRGVGARPQAGGLRLRFRRKGPQDRISGERLANHGCEVGVQEEGRLGGWAGGHERGSSA